MSTHFWFGGEDKPYLVKNSVKIDDSELSRTPSDEDPYEFGETSEITSATQDTETDTVTLQFSAPTDLDTDLKTELFAVGDTVNQNESYIATTGDVTSSVVTGAPQQIERSLRFDQTSGESYLQYTPGSNSNSRTFTISLWTKRTQPGVASGAMFSFGSNVDNGGILDFNEFNKLLLTCYFDQLLAIHYETTATFMDPSKWYHIVVAVDTTQVSASDRVKMYVDGVEITAWDNSTAGTLNQELPINQVSFNSRIGKPLPAVTADLNSYIADVHFIDGQQLSSTDFGEFDGNGVWQPISYAGTYGTNGFHLDFSDATNTTTIAEDSSGNGNNWTANNISVTAGAGNDSFFDSPTNGTQEDTGAGGEVSGNYATFNPFAKNGSMTLSDGNLTATGSSTVTGAVFTTIAFNSGKWYAEYEFTATDQTHQMGLAKLGDDLGYLGSSGNEGYGWEPYQDRMYHQGTATTSFFGQTYTSGTHILGLAVDMDAGTADIYVDGTLLGQLASGLSGSYFFAWSDIYSSGALPVTINLGQRPWTYQAPTGHKALTTGNFT